MLSPLRQSVCRNALRPHTRRALATAVEQSSTPSSEATAPPPSTIPAYGSASRRTGKQTLYIRPWNGITSMPEAYALLRSLEYKFGKMKYYQFLRDQDVPDMYQPYFFAEFENEAALEAIPIGGHTVAVDLPIFDKSTAGGVSLDDLQGLLEPRDAPEGIQAASAHPLADIIDRMAAQVVQDGESGEEKPLTRTVDVRIERSDRNAYIKGRYIPYENTANNFGKAFVKWGGFYTPPPPPTPAEEDSLNSAPSKQSEYMQYEVPRRHMEAVVESWTRKLGPAAFVEKQQPEPAPAVETDGEPYFDARPEEDISLVAEQEAQAELREGSAQATSTESEPAPVSVDALPPLVQVPISTKASLSKRREKLLELARQNARTPLPPSAIPLTPEQKEAKRKEAQEEEDEMKKTVRERLWKLMGGKWM